MYLIRSSFRKSLKIQTVQEQRLVLRFYIHTIRKDQCLEDFTSLDKFMETKSLIIKSSSYSETGTQASISTF